MKKLLAVLGLSTLLAVPVLADEAAPAAAAADKGAPVASSSADETAPAVAPSDSAAPAAAPAKKKMRAAKASKASGVDEAGIKKAFDSVSAAWAAGDAKALVKNFTFDASIINPMGTEGWGRAEAEKVVATDLEMFKGTTQTFSDFKFTPVMSNLVLVDCTGTVMGAKNPDGTDAGEKKFHVYSVVVNRGHGWQARVIRPYAFVPAPGSAPAAAAPSAAAPAAAVDKSASVPPAADASAPKMDKDKK